MATDDGSNKGKGADPSEVLLESLQSQLSAVRTHVAGEGLPLTAELQAALGARLGAFEHLVSTLLASVRAEEGEGAQYERRILVLEAGLAALEQGVTQDAEADARELRRELDALEARVLGAAELLAQHSATRDETLERQAQQLAGLARRLGVLEHRLGV